MARTIVFVDGFNLFFRVKGTRLRWLNPLALAQRMIASHNQIVGLRYFTARVSGRDDPTRPRDQHIYLSALATLPATDIHYGHFLDKKIKRPLVAPPNGGPRFVEVWSSEEKGSDVNLATHLLHEAWQAHYDVAVVITNDSDLAEPIRIITTQMKKPVGVISPAKIGVPVARKLQQHASFVRRISDADLMASQFPNPVATPTGDLAAPAGWI